MAFVAATWSSRNTTYRHAALSPTTVSSSSAVPAARATRPSRREASSERRPARGDWRQDSGEPAAVVHDAPNRVGHPRQRPSDSTSELGMRSM